MSLRLIANWKLNGSKEFNDQWAQEFFKNFLSSFSKIDDYDILMCIKIWMESEDKVISILSQMLVNRKLLKARVFFRFQIGYHVYIVDKLLQIIQV